MPIDDLIDEFYKIGNFSYFWLKYARFIPKSKNAVDITLEHIIKLHQIYEENIDKRALSYNLYFSPRGIAILPRKHLGDDSYFNLLQKEEFSTGFAFLELLGKIIVGRE